MYYVYTIKSKARNYIYVGLTSDLTRRINQHNTKRERTTRAFAPFVVILTEEYPSRSEARTREKYLKSGVGKEYLKSLL